MAGTMTAPRSPYTRSGTTEDYEAMRKDPAPLPYLQQALAIETGMYEVAESYLPPDRLAAG